MPSTIGQLPTGPSPPGQPTNLSGSSGAAGITLQWKAPQFSAAPLSYMVYRNSPNVQGEGWIQAGVTPIGVTSFTDTYPLQDYAGGVYTYAVTAVGAGGEGSPSASALVTWVPVVPNPVTAAGGAVQTVQGLVPPVPTVPSVPHAPATPSAPYASLQADGTVVVTWFASSDATGYEVLRSVNGTPATPVSGYGMPPYADNTILALPAGTLVAYSVVAVGNGGVSNESPLSNPVSVGGQTASGLATAEQGAVQEAYGFIPPTPPLPSHITIPSVSYPSLPPVASWVQQAYGQAQALVGVVGALAGGAVSTVTGIAGSAVAYVSGAANRPPPGQPLNFQAWANQTYQGQAALTWDDPLSGPPSYYEIYDQNVGSGQPVMVVAAQGGPSYQQVVPWLGTEGFNLAAVNPSVTGGLQRTWAVPPGQWVYPQSA